MDNREKIFNIAKESYPDSEAFPENYDEACKSNTYGDSLARFIAVEIWEVMEGFEGEPEEALEEAILALENAKDDIDAVVEGLRAYGSLSLCPNS